MSPPIRALSPDSSLASYDLFSVHGSGNVSSGDSDSYGTVSDDGSGSSDDDEILLSFSDLSSADFLSQRGAHTPAVFSDDGSEFVLMSRPRTPASNDLTAAFSTLSFSGATSRSHRRAASGSSGLATSSSGASPKRRSRKRRAAAVQAPGNAATSGAATKGGESSPKSKRHSPSKARRKVRRAAERAKVEVEVASPKLVVAGFGDRPIVDDVSEAGSEYSYIPPELYQSAQRYVSSVLSADPSADLHTNGTSRLAFLQALIIELGLYTSLPSLPNSMRAARALLKSQVFLNVRDYLAVRSQGIDALRGVMHPSRSALMREIRGGKKAPAKTVKDTGLGVLLVTCYR